MAPFSPNFVAITFDKMSDSKATTADSSEASRPQTVLLTKLQSENDSDDNDASVGNVFFSKSHDGSVEVIHLTPKVGKLKFFGTSY